MVVTVLITFAIPDDAPPLRPPTPEAQAALDRVLADSTLLMGVPGLYTRRSAHSHGACFFEGEDMCERP